MHKDINDGNRGKYEAKDYYHNKVLKRYFDNARKKAWAVVIRTPSAEKVMFHQRNAKLQRLKKTSQTTSPQSTEWDELLNMYK